MSNTFPDHFTPPVTPPFAAAPDTSSVFWPPHFPIITNEQQHHQQQQQPPRNLDLHPPFKRPRNYDHQQQHQQQQPFVPMANVLMNKRVSNIFFKTRMCAKFLIGQCLNGENCNFAHGHDDMRQPPPNWQELVNGGCGGKDELGNNNSNNNNNANNIPNGAGGGGGGGGHNWDDDQRIIHKMKLCKKFYNGEQCPYGERCNFLHEDPKKFRDDSGRFRESSAISVVGISGLQNLPDQFDYKGANQQPIMDPYRSTTMRTVYWKTKICSRFESTGQCSFAEKCHFAHGLAELQQHGGRIVGEMTSTGLMLAKPIIPATTLTDQPSSNAAASELAPVQDGGPDHKKRLLKWKGLQKINRIYADWIDDLPLAHSLTAGLES